MARRKPVRDKLGRFAKSSSGGFKDPMAALGGTAGKKGGFKDPIKALTWSKKTGQKLKRSGHI